MDVLLQALVIWAYASVLGGLAVVLVNKAGEGRKVGEVLAEERDWGWRRIAGMAGLGGGLVLAWLGRGAVPPGWSFPLLGLVAAVQVYRPDFSDRVCGTEGVRYGWYLRRLGELEEWRLTGDHLRFRLHGIWRAVPLPAGEHERFRARLEEAAPGRESAFSDRPRTE